VLPPDPESAFSANSWPDGLSPMHLKWSASACATGSDLNEPFERLLDAFSGADDWHSAPSPTVQCIDYNRIS
ncbi:hypothetical protein FIBSPDRAFT_880249, partial [Athelia psychrophila]